MPARLDEDYALSVADDKSIRLSELFGDKNDLLFYH